MTVLNATRGAPSTSEIRNDTALSMAGTAIREDVGTILSNEDANIADALSQHTVLFHSDNKFTFTGNALTYSTTGLEIKLVRNTTGAVFTYTIPVGETLSFSADGQILYAIIARDGSGTGDTPSTNLTAANNNLVVGVTSLPSLVSTNVWYIPIAMRIDNSGDQLLHWFFGHGTWVSGTEAFAGLTANTEAEIATHAALTSTHGVAGDIVGTTDAQTLASKTITGASFQTPSRLDVKQDTYANLITYAITATNGQLCFATDTKELYQVIDGLLEAAGGGGGEGDADTIHLIVIDDISLPDVDLKGQHSDFDGGGTITAGALTISSTAADLLKGNTSLKYLPGANGQNDYWGFTKSIPLLYRSRNIGFQFGFKTTATTLDNDFRFAVKIKDGTMAGDIQYFDIPKHDDNNTGGSLRVDRFIPHDCTEIEYGYQNTSATTTVGINIDNILVTANPFVRQDMLDEQTYKIEQNGDALTDRANEIEFNLATASITNEGSNIITAVDDPGNTRTKYVLLSHQKATVHIHVAGRLASPGNIAIIRKNGAIYTMGSMDLNAHYAVFNSTSLTLEKDDYFSVEIAGGVSNTPAPVYMAFHAQAEKEGIVHVGGSGIQYYRANGATGYGSTNNKIPHYLNVLSNDENGTYGTIEDDSTYGWSFTAKKPCMATFSVYGAAATVYDLGFSLNSSQLTTAWYSITEDSKLPGMLGGAYAGSTSSATVRLPLKVGDVVRPHTDGNVMVSGKNQIIAIAEPLPNYTIITPVTETINLELRSTGSISSSITEAVVPITHIDGLDASSVAKSSKFAKLDSNQMLLPEGEYKWAWNQDLETASYAAFWLRDVGSSDEYLLTHARTGGAVNTSSHIGMVGSFKLEKATVLELRHEVFSANASGLGEPSMYTQTHGLYGVYGRGMLTRTK